MVKTDMSGWFWLIWARRMDVSTLDGLSVVFVSGLKYSSEANPGDASSPRLDDRTELSRWIKSSVVLLGSLLCSSQKNKNTKKRGKNVITANDYLKTTKCFFLLGGTLKTMFFFVFMAVSFKVAVNKQVCFYCTSNIERALGDL